MHASSRVLGIPIGVEEDEDEDNDSGEWNRGR